MRWIDPGAVRAAFAFPLAHPAVVGAGALAWALAAAGFSAVLLVGASGAGGAGLGALALAALAFAALVVAVSAWARAALGDSSPGGFAGLRLGGDEARLAIAFGLVLVLVFTVLGTAGLLALAVVLGVTLVAAARAGVAGEPGAAIDTFALLNAGEWVVVGAVGLAFAGFAAWFLARLAMTVPATVGRGKAQILAAWPLTAGRVGELVVSALIIAAPGALVLWGLDRVFAGAAGSVEAAQAHPAAFVGAVLVGELARMVLIVAPLTTFLCNRYMKFSTSGAAPDAEGETRGDE
ncbi:hypothetical protein DDZ18_12810 [Marinicauda salina]|uniref:Glycerophosphoryl diester phosphodiesterase membrane domain-containing protein n=1 Tax=Marinicauda salina TaxID=2135793 RepID=A0A2U2BRJ2_9PROT|nr:hypothetical protein [Marinicauda salina]PWE16637.1 hypothetical protein DDZ18_12810 [Marinicauda salina]